MAFWKLVWLSASIGGIAWYIGITWYVAWKGTHDIKHMLTTLRERDQSPDIQTNTDNNQTNNNYTPADS